MEALFKNLYLVCATVGGAILVLQTILIVFSHGGDTDGHVEPGDLHDGDAGAGHDHAGDHPEHDAGAFLKMLSFKTAVAFLTFFGLGGLASAQGGFTPVPTLIVAIGAGSLAFYFVGYLIVLMSRLQSKGNLDLRNAVGATARVYLRVPGQRSGQGKVMVAVQGRNVDCKAMTEGLEIPSGSEVRVVGMCAPDTVEVLPLEKE
jgi:hypothetical protein